ncbi:MAG: hypothetical protein QNJ38_01350 [Prochloraceae cyanobacterium]|nr:hypothetical protein [Prochloraceae cyanobacterium]
MENSEAIERIRKAIKKLETNIEVYKQDAEIEGSVIKIEKAGKKLEIAISNASVEDSTIGQFF